MSCYIAFFLYNSANALSFVGNRYDLRVFLAICINIFV